MKDKINNWIKRLTLVWVFIVPFQFYLTKGFSLSVAMSLLVLLGILLVTSYLPTLSLKTVSEIVRRNRIIIVLAILTALSGIYNRFIGDFSYIDYKEITRWLLFYGELFILSEIYYSKVVEPKNVVKTFILSTFVMAVISIYQIFIPQKLEFDIVTKFIGGIFNDPELIKQKLEGVGKFNWMYGSATRLHGAFANVSHFGFTLGASFLLLHTWFLKEWKKFYYIIGAVLFGSVVISLVRSSLLGVLMIVVVALVSSVFTRKYELFIKMTLTIILGTLLAVIFGWFSYEKFVFVATIVRMIDIVTFDGALSLPFIPKFDNFYSTVNISNDGFNEYGGVGGRYNLLIITYKNVILPNVKNIFFWLFGFGPGSLGVILKSTDNEYFKAFNTVDNSFLQWFVEMGILPLVTLAGVIGAQLGKIKAIFAANWHMILFILFNALFFNILPDIRMSMITAILISTIIYNNGK